MATPFDRMNIIDAMGGPTPGQKEAGDAFDDPYFQFNQALAQQRQMFDNERQAVLNQIARMSSQERRAGLQLDASQAAFRNQQTVAGLLQELARGQQQFTRTGFDIERTRLMDELRLRQQLLDIARQGGSLNPLALPSRARQMLGR